MKSPMIREGSPWECSRNINLQKRQTQYETWSASRNGVRQWFSGYDSFDASGTASARLSQCGLFR